MFHVIDHSESDPALNLALDEALLESAEAGAENVLRFWESPIVFAVIGVGQRVREEVHVEACEADGIPVMRRCSAGGAVLQGPGSLNFTLCVRYDTWPECRSLHDSYCEILKGVLRGLAGIGFHGSIEGVSDLAIEGRKFSGNAQKRKRESFLHHGTLLYGACDLPMRPYLTEPKRRPDYRGEREHGDFVTRLPLNRAELTRAVHAGWTLDGATRGALSPEIRARAEYLAETKYRTREWTMRR